MKINEFIYDFGDRLKSRLFFFDRSVNYQVVSNYRFFDKKGVQV